MREKNRIFLESFFVEKTPKIQWEKKLNKSGFFLKICFTVILEPKVSWDVTISKISRSFYFRLSYILESRVVLTNEEMRNNY